MTTQTDHSKIINRPGGEIRYWEYNFQGEYGHKEPGLTTSLLLAISLSNVKRLIMT